MTRYVALLRGVNVGRANQLPMEQLRETIGELGYSDVRTHLRSGNVVLTTRTRKPDDIARAIESAIADRFELSVGCIVRTGAELRSVITANPLARHASDGSKLLALFLSDALPPGPATEHDLAEFDPDGVRVGDRVIYQWCPDGVIAAPNLVAFVGKRFGVTATGRNWNTVTKLAALTEETR